MTTTAPAAGLSRLLNQRRWTRGEKRVLLVLLSGGRLLTRDRIERVAHSRPGTVNMVLMLLESYGLVGHTDLGHHYLTRVGRAFALQVVGVE